MPKKKAASKPAAKKAKGASAPAPAPSDNIEDVEYVFEKGVSLERLYQDPENARIHGERNMQAIKSSLRAFKQVEPLVVQKSSGMIIGGNGRFEAMRQLGWTHCDVQWVDLSDILATKLGLMLNRTGDLAETNEDALSALLHKLREAGEDMTDGWTEAELKKLQEDVEVPEDDGPEPNIAEQFLILVTCKDEAQQTELLQDLEADGIEAKAMVS